MKKQITAAVLAAVTAFCSAQLALADSDKVEISFKVGDSILNINGTPTEVETPYVAGAGTTLVPLRVITEAFGAQVDWEGSTKTITLRYPDVNIVLQIGNIVADVNNHSETLSEAPVLSENGVTMVPLRFISEAFGAVVGYDSDTRAITVIKELSDDLTTVTGVTDMARTGDSYYKWSIDTPKQMEMTDRSADALSTSFTADDGSELTVSIYGITEDTLSFDEAFSNIKDYFKSYTLVNAEKLTDEKNNKYIHLQVKDKEEFIDIREYYTDRYIYDVMSYINAGENDETKNMIISLADSFKIGETDASTYDLSSVKSIEGIDFRTITDEDYKVSFIVPADYCMDTSSASENTFKFYDDAENSIAYVSLEIYSKTADVTAEKLARLDNEIRRNSLNPEFVELSDVVSENGMYKYTQTISGTKSSNSYAADMFFDKGEYVYNFTVYVNDKNDTVLLNSIINSLETEELDAGKIGKLMRNDEDNTDMSVKFGDYRFTMPSSWKKVTTSSSGAMLMNSRTGSGIVMSVAEDSSISAGDFGTVVSSAKKSFTDDKDNEIINDVRYKTINNKKYAYFTYKQSEKDADNYITVYITLEKGKMFTCVLMQTDIYYNSAEISDTEKILETLTEE